MIKRLLLLLTCFVCLTAGAQKASYLIKEVTGLPEKTTNGKKVVLQKGDKLTDSDQLNMPFNARLTLIDQVANKEYIVRTSGTGTVKAMLKDSKNTVVSRSKEYIASVANSLVHKGKKANVRVVDPCTVTREGLVYDENAIAVASEPEQGEDNWGFRKRYIEFREKAWNTYLEFTKRAWEEYRSEEPLKMPSEKELPPVILLDEDDSEGVVLDDNLMVELQKEEQGEEEATASVFSVFDKLVDKIKKKKKNKDTNVTTVPARPKTEESRPVKVEKEALVIPAPEEEKPDPFIRQDYLKNEKAATKEIYKFKVFGTEYQVHMDDSYKFKMKGTKESDVVDALKTVSTEKYRNLLSECMEIRDKHELSDWAYYKVLQSMTNQFMGKGNEATLLTAFLYSWSGYKMRLAFNDSRLMMLLACQHTIYNKSFFEIDGIRFYVMEDGVRTLSICKANLLNEQGLSLFIPKEQKFDMVQTPERTYVSRKFPDMKFTVHSNKNQIDFCNDYPQSTINDDLMTKWAIYANVPLAANIREEVYPQLKPILSGKSEYEQVRRILDLVQTGFKYELDDKIWGGDRPFFAEETLYYPYQDCEDRSVLFSRLVRDLVGLPIILVYYPGHLATAVGFNEEVPGDYIKFGGRRYVVCDPTYIGAPVGRTMPQCDNSRAKVILLDT
ncbi:MAG: transglutaminase domain-containing protein [Prevotella sp.]|nr:transglutaminase domain-containing protein [Prevotella sp.]